MIDWLTFGEPEQVVLRQWTDGFEIENEFRLFVCEGRLTAASQYDHYAYYPALHEAHESLQLELQQVSHDIQPFNVALLLLTPPPPSQWWQGVHSFVNGERGSYVMDVAWFPSSDGSTSSKFVLIELSPFFHCTGSALFNWQRDAQLLRDGPYSLRLKNASDVHPQMSELILCNWSSRWPLQDATTLVFAPPFTQILEQAQQQPQQQPVFGLPVFGLAAETISGAISSLFGALVQPSKQLLFVYGTLKRGFQWNTKYKPPFQTSTLLFCFKHPRSLRYMADRLGCSFVCEATTVQVLLQTLYFVRFNSR